MNLHIKIPHCWKSCVTAHLVQGIDCFVIFQLNNEDTPRYDSSVGEAYQKAFQALNLLLPGTAFTYYGDEIAMSNGVVVGAANKDPMFNAGKVN